jgi:hypothetical protein
MTPSSNRPFGLSVISRHLVILLSSFTLLLGVLVLAIKFIGIGPSMYAPGVILIGSPWLLGVLVLAVERNGPVKYWAAPLLLSLTSPALAVCHNWVIVDFWRQTGAIPNVLVSLTINAILIGSFSAFFVAMYPGCCPRCGHRSLIPLRKFWGQSKRTPNTRWCGSCGAQYWRDRQGIWQKERRATWVDATVPATPTPVSSEDPSRTNPGEAGSERSPVLPYSGPRAAGPSHRTSSR